MTDREKAFVLHGLQVTVLSNLPADGISVGEMLIRLQKLASRLGLPAPLMDNTRLEFMNELRAMLAMKEEVEKDVA